MIDVKLMFCCIVFVRSDNGWNCGMSSLHVFVVFLCSDVNSKPL